MEARLTDPAYEPRVLDGVRERLPCSELSLRIEHYLSAAGATDEVQRSHLLAATARDLLARGCSGDVSWAEIIAAVDRRLAAELLPKSGAREAPGARGRIALAAAERAKQGGPEAPAPVLPLADWGTPPRHRRSMRPQELSLCRPNADWLRRLQIRRSTQGLAACACWLAILFIP